MDVIDYLQSERTADKAIKHYQRILAGAGLTQADRRWARIQIIKTVFARAEVRERMEKGEQVEAVGV